MPRARSGLAMLSKARHVREEREVLERHADVALLGRRRPSRRAPSIAMAPRVGLVDAGDQAQQHGLAGAGRAEDDDDLAALDGERDAVEHLAGLEATW